MLVKEHEKKNDSSDAFPLPYQSESDTENAIN